MKVGKRIFGNVHMLRGLCPKCECEMFCGADMACLSCGAACTSPGRGVKRDAPGRFKRKAPSGACQHEILAAQGSRCFWCERAFGSLVLSRGGAIRERRVQWDHFIPYAFTGSCDDIEFVASCQLCNGIKHSSIFDSPEECRLYIVRRLAKLGYEDCGL